MGPEDIAAHGMRHLSTAPPPDAALLLPARLAQRVTFPELDLCEVIEFDPRYTATGELRGDFKVHAWSQRTAIVSKDALRVAKGAKTVFTIRLDKAQLDPSVAGPKGLQALDP